MRILHQVRLGKFTAKAAIDAGTDQARGVRLVYWDRKRLVLSRLRCPACDDSECYLFDERGRWWNYWTWYRRTPWRVPLALACAHCGAAFRWADCDHARLTWRHRLRRKPDEVMIVPRPEGGSITDAVARVAHWVTA